MSEEIRRPFDYDRSFITNKIIKNVYTTYIESAGKSIMYIKNNLENIIRLFDNAEYDQIIENITSFDEVVGKLFMYCLYENDIELLKNIIFRTNGADLFELIGSGSTTWHSTTDLFMNTNEDTWELILSEMHITDLHMTVCVDILRCIDKIPILEKFLARGYKMTLLHIEHAIRSCDTDLIRHALIYNYDIQNIFNEHNFLQYMTPITIDMVKLLVGYGIDISSKIDYIFIYASLYGELDLVKYCVENNYACEINLALTYACMKGHFDLVTYLLSIGADVHRVHITNIYSDDIKIFKILIEHGYHIPIEQINLIFYRCFISAKNTIPDILFLIDYGANPEYMFDHDTSNYDNITKIVGHPEKYEAVNSLTEFIVSMGYISHVKYLSEVNYNKLLLELDRLFIVACANGQIEMATYLLELGANINAENNMAMNVACYFGHINMVKFLLDKIDLTDITENLFMTVMSGYISLTHEVNETNVFAPYRKLRGTNNILRNDLYNIGESHTDIFELLRSKDINLTEISKILDILPDCFYNKEFFSHIISIGFDISSTCQHDQILNYLTEDFLSNKLSLHSNNIT